MKYFLFCCLIIISIGCKSHTSKFEKNKNILLLKVDSIVIDHVLILREGCRRSQVKVFVNINNKTNNSFNLNRGQKQYFCFLRHLKPIFFMLSSSNKKDSLFFGLPKEIYISPYSTTKVEFIVLNKYFVGSLNRIKKEVLEWFKATYSFKFVLNDNIKMNLVTDWKNKYKMTYMLDDKIIDINDSINMNQQDKISELPQ